MNKMQNKQQQKQDRRKSYGWFLWIVALIFIQGVYGTELTTEEKDAMVGLYFNVSPNNVSAVCTSINTDNQLLISQFDKYELKKYDDAETLSDFSAINGTYYFKHATRSNQRLVVTADGTLYIVNTDRKTTAEVLYKIIKDENISDHQNKLESKIYEGNTSMIKHKFDDQQYEKAKELSDKLIQPFTRGSVLPPPKPTEILTIATDDTQTKQPDANLLKVTTNYNFESKVVYLSVGVIALIAFVIVLCVLCCGGRNQANVHLESNDPRNHYPSPTDLVINIRTTGTIESTDTSTHSNSTASTVSLEKLESDSASSSLLTFTSTASETFESEETNDTNDTSTTDDFSI